MSDSLWSLPIVVSLGFLSITLAIYSLDDDPEPKEPNPFIEYLSESLNEFVLGIIKNPFTIFENPIILMIILLIIFPPVFRISMITIGWILEKREGKRKKSWYDDEDLQEKFSK